VKKGRRGRAVLRLYFFVINPIMLIITAVSIDIQKSNQNCCVFKNILSEKSIRKSPTPNPSLNFLKPYISISRIVINTITISPEDRAFRISCSLIIELVIKYIILRDKNARVGVCGIAL